MTHYFCAEIGILALPWAATDATWLGSVDVPIYCSHMAFMDTMVEWAHYQSGGESFDSPKASSDTTPREGEKHLITAC